MDSQTHQEATITKAIKMLDVEISHQRDLLEALEAARDVLQLHVLPIDGSPRMTRQEVLEYLEISNSSLDRYIRGYNPKGKPPFPLQVGKIGHKALFRRADIMAWKEAYDRTPRGAAK